MILQGGDGGDSAANMGTYHIFLEARRRGVIASAFHDGRFANKEKTDFMVALLKLEDSGRKGLGLFRRHPNPDFWGSRINTMSRDQTIPLLGAMALYGLKKAAWKYILGHALRGFLFTTNTTPNWSDPVRNKSTLTAWQRVKFFFGWQIPGVVIYATKLPDLTIGDFWALELRGIYTKWLWPIFFPWLCILDLFTLVGSFEKVMVYGKDARNSDDRNHINTMVVGLQICPTPVMKIAAWVYSTRPHAGNASATASGPQSALDAYYSADDAPPLNIVGAPIIKYYFEGKIR